MLNCGLDNWHVMIKNVRYVQPKYTVLFLIVRHFLNKKTCNTIIWLFRLRTKFIFTTFDDTPSVSVQKPITQSFTLKVRRYVDDNTVYKCMT